MKVSDKHIIKNVRQFSYELSGENYSSLLMLSGRYNTVKNYVYKRFSGIGSMLQLGNHRKDIRDVWVESKFGNQWKLPSRYWKIALDDAAGSLKSR